MKKLSLLALLASMFLIQCRPCRWSGCGCDFQGINELYVIEQMKAEFHALFGTNDTTQFYPISQATIVITVSKASLLAQNTPKAQWSFIPTAQACDPAVDQKATTYFSDIIIINQKKDTVFGQIWNIGDTITSHFNFGLNYSLKPIADFLKTHDSIDRYAQYKLRLKNSPQQNKRLKFTVDLVMTDRKIFSFPNLEMRVY